MTIISKPFYLILFMFGFLLAFVASPAIAQDKDKPNTLYNKAKDEDKPAPKILKSAKWKTPKPEKEVKEEEEKETAETPIENKPVEELTENQKLWKKYKDLADGGRKNDDKTDDKTKTKDDEENPEEKVATDAEPKEESPVGIKSIIEDYKNANKNKGKMNSRSFGKID